MSLPNIASFLKAEAIFPAGIDTGASTLQVDSLDTIAAAVAKDAQVQAAAVSLAKEAAAASGAYWAAAPTVRPC